MAVANRIFIGLAVTAVLGAIICFADPFPFAVVAIATGLFLGVPGFLAALVFLVFARAKQRSMRWPGVIVKGILILGVAVTGIIMLNMQVHRCYVTATIAYLDRVVPLLEQHRQETGRYPDSLDQLRSPPQMPWLSRARYTYRSDGHNYSFCIPVPEDMIDSWDYSSETHSWHLST